MRRITSGVRAPDRPAWLWVPAAVALAFLVVPLIAVMTRLPFSQVPGLLSAPEARSAMWLSLRTALAATLVCVLLGLPLALVLARAHSRALVWLRALVVVPLVMPPVVAGMALLAAFGRTGLLGQRLSVIGVDIAFSTTAVVLAQAFVAMPFFVMAAEGALRTLDPGYARSAASLGMAPGRILWRATVPMIRPALASGTLLAFARALGEFGATLTFAGSMPGVTRTLPLEIYVQREVDPNTAMALSMLLIVTAIAITAATYRRWVR